ncbi:MAG TPA: PQQ-dependent sugar dehydrogenase, partial [Anaerolineales bacterium]|nr:PQQ-dependent sugar dehydrogenase [Anaerolineales bacterium]
MRRFLLVILPLLIACSLAPSTTPLAPATPRDATPSPSPAPAPTETLVPSPTASAPPFVTSFPDPSAFVWTRLPGDFSRPVDLQDLGDGRLLVVQQAGTIMIHQNGGVLPEPFLDLRDRVGVAANEQGLLGLALHPDYASNGILFVNYTDLDGDTVISRFQASADPGRADASS